MKIEILLKNIIDNEGRLKSKLYDKHDDFTFPIVSFPFTSYNIQVYGVFTHQYVILEHVPRLVFFWIEFSWWRKSYSNKATLLLGWGHRYENSAFVITIWLTVTKYPFLKRKYIFPFYEDFSFLYHRQEFYRTWLYIWVARRVSYEEQELVTIR